MKKANLVVQEDQGIMEGMEETHMVIMKAEVEVVEDHLLSLVLKDFLQLIKMDSQQKALIIIPDILSIKEMAPTELILEMVMQLLKQ